MSNKTVDGKPLHKALKTYQKDALSGKLDRREFLAYATALGATTATA